jgi:hypothetical protein
LPISEADKDHLTMLIAGDDLGSLLAAGVGMATKYGPTVIDFVKSIIKKKKSG